jgi:hypothetical protein
MRCLVEGVEQTLHGRVGGAAAIGMAAHAIDHDHQRRLVRSRNGDAILIVFAITDEAYICILDPQARAPAGRLFSCYTWRRFIHWQTARSKTAFALIPFDLQEILAA